MKSIKEWLETLPEPYRTKALDECDKLGSGSVPKESLSGAICDAFIWSQSKQGGSYWSDVNRRAKAGEFDQPAELEALRQENAALKAQLAAKEPLKVGDRVRVELEGEVADDVGDGTYKIFFDGTDDNLEFAWLKPERLTRI